MSKRNGSSVITPVAYLLFYRRRSSEYLGSPDLRKLVKEYRDPEEVSDSADEEDAESDSRATSPSGQGKGHRLGGTSFLNGSPSSSAGQGAGRLHRRGGDGLAAAGQGMRVRNGGGAIRGLDGYDADGDEDEGYGGGDDDVDDALPEAGSFIGPQRPPSYQDSTMGNTSFSAYQPWSFAGIPDTQPSAGNVSDAEGDVDSMGMEGDNVSDRMIEDFGDDLSAPWNSGHQTSPVLPSTEMGEDMDFLGDQMGSVEHMEHSEDPVVEIRVDDSPPASHAKKE